MSEVKAESQILDIWPPVRGRGNKVRRRRTPPPILNALTFSKKCVPLFGVSLWADGAEQFQKIDKIFGSELRTSKTIRACVFRFTKTRE